MTENMTQEPYQITFLLDKSNNWIEEHLVKTNIFISDDKYNFKISRNHFDVAHQDVVFICGYTKIFDNNFLKKNRLNLVIHESDLPLGKGFAPVQWQILEGKKEIPICLIEATEKIDAGDIVYKTTFNLTGFELFDEIRMLQANATFSVILDFLKVYPNYKRNIQSGDESFYPRRGIKDNELNVDKTIREQFNLLRIGNNEGWPSYFYIGNHKYIVKIYKDTNV